MIKVEHVDVHGWEAAIRGMRNPMNSWSRSDSHCGGCGYVTDGRDPGEWCGVYGSRIGENDLTLMIRLMKSGSDHRKFMRMITVTLDVNAPLYWWKEFDTYKVGTVANSCSTMHKIHEKAFFLDDFSHEHLLNLSALECTIAALNHYRLLYLQTKDKRYWWQMIQLLPSSYNQRRTLQLNYEVLRNMYHARKNHKLDEWRAFCEWMAGLPHSELITWSKEVPN